MKISKLNKGYVIGATIGIAGICGVATAGDIGKYANGSWMTFGWSGYMVEATGSQPADPYGQSCVLVDGAVAADAPPWTVNVGPSGATVTILDGWITFDQFELYDSGVFVGETSTPNPAGSCETPDECLTDPDASRGQFTLVEGSHALTIQSIGNPPYGSTGCAWFRIDGDVVADIEVDIDIKPRNTRNNVRPNASGLIPVAILTTDVFDAQDVDPDTVTFGPNAAKETHSRDHLQDVDNDGDLDALFHFRISETGIQCGDAEATLTGETKDGIAITGTDSINTTRCGSRATPALQSSSIPDLRSSDFNGVLNTSNQ